MLEMWERSSCIDRIQWKNLQSIMQTPLDQFEKKRAKEINDCIKKRSEYDRGRVG